VASEASQPAASLNGRGSFLDRPWPPNRYHQPLPFMASAAFDQILSNEAETALATYAAGDSFR
jgi:hypothetical protein